MIVNCCAYQNGKKLTDLKVSEISEYLKIKGAFVWVALFEPTEDELLQMKNEFELHELAVEDAKHGHQRPKLEEYGEQVFMVAKTFEFNESELLEGEVAIFVGRNFVLSVRQKSKNGFANVRVRCENEPDLLKHGPGFVCYAILDTVVDRYIPLITALEIELEQIESEIFRGALPKENVAKLYLLKQKVMTIKYAVSSTMEAVGKLFGGRVPGIFADSQEYFRDVYDHLLRANGSLETMRESLITAMQVNLSMIALSDATVTKSLASYGALVAVPTMVAGIYGMNFQHMPELHSPYGYPMVLIGMIAIDLILYRHFKKTGWL